MKKKDVETVTCNDCHHTFAPKEAVKVFVHDKEYSACPKCGSTEVLRDELLN